MTAWLFAIDHKRVGILYMLSALAVFPGWRNGSHGDAGATGGAQSETDLAPNL